MFEPRMTPSPVPVDIASAMREPLAFRRRLWDNEPKPQPNHAEPASAESEFARGMAEGQRLAEINFASDRKALVDLIASAEALRAEACDDLTGLIGATVLELVRQIVGSAPVDADWLRAQIATAAAVIAMADQDRVVCLNPEDAALLDVNTLGMPVRVDAGRPRGSIAIATGEGWVEHGRPVYLDAIKAALTGQSGQ